MDPPLAESLFVHVPLTWVTSGDAMRRRQGLAVLTLSWEIFFEHAQQEILLQALPSDLALAATWPDEDFEAIVSFLADRVTLASETHLPDSLPTASWSACAAIGTTISGNCLKYWRWIPRRRARTGSLHGPSIRHPRRHRWSHTVIDA